jgi:hypothetical protein
MQDTLNSTQSQSDMDMIIQLMDKMDLEAATNAKNMDTKVKNINENLMLFQRQTTREIDMIKNTQNQHHEEFRQLQITISRLSNELEVIRRSKKIIK